MYEQIIVETFENDSFYVVELWSSCFHAAQKVCLTFVCVWERERGLLGDCLASPLPFTDV